MKTVGILSRSFSPYLEKFIGRLEMEKSSLCTAHTWLIKRSCI